MKSGQSERTALSRQQRRALERKRNRGVALTLGVGVAFAAGQAGAASFNVTTLNDNGLGSLRQALDDANALAGPDVVTFQAGLTGTVTLTTGQLEITDSVDVQGPGAAVITVDGDDASRVFYLYAGGALLDVSISGLTVTGGNAPYGGGIVNYGENLTLDGVTITGNHAGSAGGGLWTTGGGEVPAPTSLIVRGSTVSGNTTDCCGAGAGIFVDNTETVLIQDSVISGNEAGAVGGGLFLYATSGTVTIEDSTIAGNTAGGAGGGVYLYDTDGGSVTFRRTTISGNSALAGGGMFVYGPDDPVLIENSTLSGNQAFAGAGGYFYVFYDEVTLRHTTVAGNGAYVGAGGLLALSGALNVENSIVGDNTAPFDPDVAGDGDFDVSFSLIEDPGTAFLNDNGGNVFNQDPQLGPLADNGGPTETHLPAGTSPAVNAGDPGFVPPPATDQRGSARVAGPALDMGSVELNPGVIQLTASAVSVAESVGTVTVTATRTGGSEGAVSVSFTTANGTAVQPMDYGTAAGILNWAHLDSAPKSFQVTIVDDPDPEGDEVFNASIANPQGGATLGTPTTQAVTILSDPLDGLAPPPLLEIPTLGDYGKLLFAALTGLGGFLLLRRRKGAAAASLLVVSLLAAEAEAGGGKRGVQRERRAAVVVSVDTDGTTATIRLADGSRLVLAREDLQLRPEPKKKAARRKAAAVDGRPAILKIRRDAEGKVTRVKIVYFDSLDQAKKALAAERDE